MFTVAMVTEKLLIDADNNCSDLMLILSPAQRYASAGNSDRNVSVRLSVTSRYCVKMKKASVLISLLPGSPKTLVF